MSIQEFAFKVITPIAKTALKRIFESSDDLLKRHPEYPTIKTKDPDVVIRYRKTKITTAFWLTYKGKVGGTVDFERMNSEYPEMRSVFAVKQDLFTPHVMLGPAFKGRGYAAFFYAQALKKGTLVTEYQTQDADLLWERVAKQTGARVFYFDLMEGVEVPETDRTGRHVLKVMTKEQLKPNKWIAKR